MPAVRTIEWGEGAVRMIDQTALPGELVYYEARTVEDVALAIEALKIRGAPAIGVAAAFGMALAAINNREQARLGLELGQARDRLARTRPTAVNLFWALDRMREAEERLEASGADIVSGLVAEAQAVLREDLETNRALGRHGAELLPDEGGVLTHCNAGALATGGYGTALGVIRAAVERGKRIHVWVDETRPVLQGARLTAWELAQEGIPHTLISDNAAATLMRGGQVDCVIVGADRIAANGDVANKIGTYAVALAANHHRVPFYVAAPVSTVDLRTACGDEIVVEQRGAEEVTCLAGKRIAPANTEVWNPAFDVTPNVLVRAIVTERGVVQPPYKRRIAELLG